jgi:predicted permease
MSLQEFFRDLRYACRMLRRSPGFTTVAVLTLALGIGANTAVFSIVYGALLRPLPYREPGRLVAIWDHGLREGNLSKVFDSYHDFAEWKQHARSFEALGAATWATGLARSMSGRGPARQVLAVPVSETFFATLGVPAARGRTFVHEDLTRGCSVVLAYSFWSGASGADPAMVGQSVALGRQSCTVLGVMPPGFSFYPKVANMWILLTPDFVPPLDKLQVGVFGRLKPGVTAAQAQSEVTALHDALHRADGQERNLAPVVYDLQQEFTWLAGRNLRTTLWVLLGAVGLVLLIACFNVANLLLGRSFVRGRELAIRAAVGCGRARLVRQLLTEGLALSILGGSLGIAFAWGALRFFRSANPVELPVGADIAFSAPGLFFTATIAIGTALVFALAPAWRASRVDVNEALKRGAGIPASIGSAKVLVAAEMALSVLLLSGAGLLLESVIHLGSAPLGFEPDGLYAASLSLPQDRYADAGRRERFFDALLPRLSVLPAVQHAALASALPPQDGGSWVLEILGRPVSPETIKYDVVRKSVSPDYFRTAGVSLVRGRLFDARDRKDSGPVAVIDESLAREYFPNADPIGRQIRAQEQAEQPWATIVGVVEGQKRSIVYQEMGWIDSPSMFRPLAQDPPPVVWIALRTRSSAVPLAAALAREVVALDSEVPVGELESLRERVTVSMAYPRFRAVVLGGFAGFALLLAAVGLHGVLTQLVAQRRQEIGVRLALGAQPANVVRLVATHGSVPVLLGLTAGLSCALAVNRFLGAFLYGVRPRDPFTLGLASGTLLLAAAIAIALPARRAARTDPMDALRQE